MEDQRWEVQWDLDDLKHRGLVRRLALQAPVVVDDPGARHRWVSRVLAQRGFVVNPECNERFLRLVGEMADPVETVHHLLQEVEEIADALQSTPQPDYATMLQVYTLAVDLRGRLDRLCLSAQLGSGVVIDEEASYDPAGSYVPDDESA